MESHGTPSCTNGQFATMASRVITALPKAIKLAGLEPSVLLKHTDHGERLSLALAEAIKMLHGGHPATITQDMDLVFVTEITIPAITERMDPKDFFKDSPGCSFRILSTISAIDSAPEASFAIFYINRNVNESVIREKLRDYELAEWYHFAVLAENQSEGGSGPLTTNGKVNIFHVRGSGNEVFIFGAYWNGVGFDEWVTNEYLPGEIPFANRWRTGGLVFLRIRK